MTREVRLPPGLGWEERDESGEWHAEARVQLTGRQVVRALGLVIVAFVCMFPGTNGSTFAAALGVASIALAVLVLARRRPPIRFTLRPAGLTVGGHPAIAPLVDIGEFDVEHEPALMTQGHDRLRVRVGQESRVFELPEHDPLFRRFMASRLNAALARHRERYR
jgi:hypothetical protein